MELLKAKLITVFSLTAALIVLAATTAQLAFIAWLFIYFSTGGK